MYNFESVLISDSKFNLLNLVERRLHYVKGNILMYFYIPLVHFS